ncbi:hypothetical protein [Campylobacter sp. VBCF_01 NA2]|uniref:hypothetical protein n=1 Tax=Campylobacter sp. VBCF_01 NA2 TaxID=2983836 RepID=UPI0022E9C863|nr:hypothetical protein [Campylobacter sp. VBCF_01 NA2]WBR54629.1 hypothetical protein PF027_01805 [Campylobacter sp. VBCF_01 NA2]
MSINLKRNLLYFLVGASFGLIFVGAFIFFSYPAFYFLGLKFLLICTAPGIVCVIITCLLVDLLDLKEQLENKK